MATDWIQQAREMGWRFYFDEIHLAIFAVHPLSGRHRVAEVTNIPVLDAETIGRAIESHLNGSE